MRRAAALMVAVVVSFASALEAQTTSASVTGQITDPSKGIISGAKVVLINTGTNLRYEGTTNETGNYYVTRLPAGTYRIEVEKPGFKTVVNSDIILHVQAVLEINFEMALGSTSEVVSVTAGVPDVQLATSNLSGDVNSTTIRELPLNGRDWTQLATLQPGVLSTASIQNPFGTAVGGPRGNRGFGDQLAISGARPVQSSYRVDGININDYGNGSPGSVLGGTLGVDAIAEFSVLTSNYSAEYGRTSGGVVNAITKSGTNQFHGNAYEFLRNSALDAANFFDNFSNTPKPPFKRNQFGGSAGGPIWKDRTFFFADYEGLRQSLGVTNVIPVPSPDARNGILDFPPGGFPSGCVPTSVPNQCAVVVNPKVTPFLALWGLPNVPGSISGNTGLYSFSANPITSENFVTARVDHKISEKDTLFGSWQYDNSTITSPDSVNGSLQGASTRRQFVALEESHIFTPQLVNSFRVGFNRNVGVVSEPVKAINPAAADLSLGAIPGIDAPQLDVPGIADFPGGLNAVPPAFFYLNAFQAYDDAFLTKGIHSLKFGLAVERDQENEYGPPTASGDFPFGSLANFLTGQPDSFSAPLPGSLPPVFGLRQSIFGGYLQDDVRWRSNLTINLGVRYEMATVPTEVHGKLSVLRHLTDPTLHIGDPYFSNPTLRNFEPRVGFSWDPFRDGKTAVRGGFGLFDVLPLSYQFINKVVNVAPFSPQATVAPLPPGAFPTGAFADLSPAGVSPDVRVLYIQPNPPRNYVMQWNLNIQRELTTNLTAAIAYAGSRGVHMTTQVDDANVVLPTKTPAGYLWPSAIGSGVRMNPNFGRINYVDYGSNSFFDALEVKITKRMSHSFQVQGSYTWSKSIDESSANGLSDSFLNAIGNLLWFDRRTRRGLSDFNVGQNLVINYIWDVPSSRSLHGPAPWMLGGWQLGGIFTIQSGTPFTPLLGGDPLGADPTDSFAYPNRLTGAGCQSPVNPGNPNNYIKLNCFTLPAAPASLAAVCTPFAAAPGTCANLLGNSGRNVVIGPGLVNFDFSVFKNNYIRKISENFNLQFRAELFNVFNRANFASPVANSTLFDSSGSAISSAGLITSTSTPAREIQFGVKINW